MSDLRGAQAAGYIDKLPHFNSIFNYLENPNLTARTIAPDCRGR